MIPSIETIVEDLVAGKITKSQAVTWLHAHAEGAANDLRDQFAAAALPELIREALDLNHVKWDATAGHAYIIADAMMEARKAK